MVVPYTLEFSTGGEIQLARWSKSQALVRQEDLIAHGNCVSASSGQVSGVGYGAGVETTFIDRQQ